MQTFLDNFVRHHIKDQTVSSRDA